MNSGITPSCGGIIMVPTVSASSAPRPRKRSLAKANPASVEESTTPAVTTPETISELSSALPISACWSASPMLWNRFGPGVNAGVVELSSELERLAATSVQ